METEFKQETFTKAFSTFYENYNLWEKNDAYKSDKLLIAYPPTKKIDVSKISNIVKNVIEGIKLITGNNGLMKNINLFLKNIGDQKGFTAQDVTEKIAGESYGDLYGDLWSCVPRLLGPFGGDTLNMFKQVQESIKSKPVEQKIKDFYTACYNIAIFCRLISDANKK